MTVEVEPDAWGALLKHLDLQSSFLASSSEQLVSVLVSNMASKPRACVSALRSLLALQPGGVVPVLVGEVCQLLEEQKVLVVSEEDMEVMHTPEGQLWHAGMRKE